MGTELGDKRVSTEQSTSEGSCLDEALVQRAMEAYGRAMAVTEPIRLRYWDRRGLTMSQLRLMFLICRSEGRSVGELAEEMQVKPATLTGLADRLAAQALIERAHDQDDRRVVRVRLTEDGRALLAEITVAAHAHFVSVLERMHPADIETMIASLKAFRTASEGLRLPE